MHLNNKRILIMNLYFSKEDKELTERVEVKNKPVNDKNCDNLETGNKPLLYSVLSQKDIICNIKLFKHCHLLKKFTPKYFKTDLKYF